MIDSSSNGVREFEITPPIVGSRTDATQSPREIAAKVLGASPAEIHFLSPRQRLRLVALLESGHVDHVERVGAEGWHFHRDGGPPVLFSTAGLAHALPEDLKL